MGKKIDKIEIEEIDWGLAYRRGNTVYVNRHLKSFDPLLYRHIVNHELRHLNTAKFSLQDFKNDVKDAAQVKFGIQKLKFLIFHPKSAVQLVPVWFRKDPEDGETIMSIDYSSLISYAFFILFGVLIYFLITSFM